MARAQERVPGVEARAGKFPGPSLIPALHAIQERVGWLPREELVALSRDVRRPLYEIEGLISFYPHFRTDPPGQVALHVCHDLSCWLQGADQRIAALRERRPLPDERLAALQGFALDVVATTGAVSPESLAAFLSHGYTAQNALEVVLGIGTYTMSTLANRMVRAPLDDQLMAFAWQEPVA